ncbi:Spermatid-specific manchette-related protein 1 [Apaloderma vittatum]|uniref:Spermatid-specific manchette-related protein 1 n=1 Tax=Apaloderma vittatum TaxID=57397 RepID=A0A091MV61_APAVI|nr:Spermatid-specific manchette-related protein 1 [Apaloderma vittatum]
MFLFSKKHKTPVSTYTDSYRPPHSVKKAYRDETARPVFKENKFVTQGLTVPPVQNQASQIQPKDLIKAEMQEYYRNTIDPSAYWPQKYWMTRSEEKYNPVFVNEDKYITWRTGPYNSAAWNKYSTYLPLPSKETRMNNLLQSTPVQYPPKSTCLNQTESEAVTSMLHKQPIYTMSGRGPFQGYYSPSSGCHYCLRGMDYYVDGAHTIRKHLHSPEERAEYSVLQLQPQNDILYIYPWCPAILLAQEP